MPGETRMPWPETDVFEVGERLVCVKAVNPELIKGSLYEVVALKTRHQTLPTHVAIRCEDGVVRELVKERFKRQTAVVQTPVVKTPVFQGDSDAW